MRRREFIAFLGGAAGWPLTARAQQTEKPVIGFLDGRFAEAIANRLRGFHRGLREAGYVEGENVTVLYRYAENQSDRLPALAGELTRRSVAVIVASGGPTVMSAAKQATAIIPVVFLSGEDPVRAGLVASLARPGGNLTGINFFNREIASKQLEFLRELVPSAKRIAVLVNPTNARVTEGTLGDLEPAARAKGLQIQLSKPVLATRLMRPSRPSRVSGQTPCLSPPTRSLPAGVFSCRFSPCDTLCQQSIRVANMPRWAG